ncbi:putative N-acetyltransferase YhbS [Anaerosolibacter carboniphilus]|uniref:Putative N-acetyltransferase YhbS n=1 Tax=Anaerosolibacter carboniphilus TaxID=1417629 RepID=A0A841KZ38_9FIRM|nr:N-acetyltransferase [Anaerosolibacter carboniphilus]MBB6218593.1 putative N-acetyltransferase YhbS [Anaerosolibacter carboniphilus]
MIIRQERPTDYNEVYELVKKSFATSTNEGEWDYLNEVRKKDTFIPELSLVTENEDGKLIGQIVLYKTNITTSDNVYTELLLSPISVHPDFFRKGIARTMMMEAFRIAKSMKYTSVFLCGGPEFYHKFGFKPSYEYGIFHIADKTKKAEWCMALELIPGALANKAGTINIQ